MDTLDKRRVKCARNLIKNRALIFDWIKEYCSVRNSASTEAASVSDIVDRTIAKKYNCFIEKVEKTRKDCGILSAIKSPDYISVFRVRVFLTSLKGCFDNIDYKINKALDEICSLVPQRTIKNETMGILVEKHELKTIKALALQELNSRMKSMNVEELLKIID